MFLLQAQDFSPDAAQPASSYHGFVPHLPVQASALFEPHSLTAEFSRLCSSVSLAMPETCSSGPCILSSGQLPVLDGGAWAVCQVVDPELDSLNPVNDLYLQLAKNLTGLQAQAARDLKPDHRERQMLDVLIRTPPIGPIVSEGRELLWTYRYYLASNYPRVCFSSGECYDAMVVGNFARFPMGFTVSFRNSLHRP